MITSRTAGAPTRSHRDCCPICGAVPGRRPHPIRDHHSLEEFALTLCESCGAYFIVDPPLPEHLGNYYDNAAGSAMHGRPNRLFAALRAISIRRDLAALLAQLQPGASIIDFGTGDGSVARHLHDRGYAVRAVDMYDPSEWPFADIPYSRFNMADAASGPQFLMDGRPADAVVLRHVLEHLIEPRRLLTEARSAGVRHVFAVVPNASSRLSRHFGDNWFYWDPPRHLTAFTPGSLRRLAELTGYRVTELTTSGVDEVLTSIHRVLLLSNGSDPPRWRRRAAQLTRPTGMAAGLSSVAAALVAGSVCRVVLSAEPQRVPGR